MGSIKYLTMLLSFLIMLGGRAWANQGDPDYVASLLRALGSKSALESVDMKFKISAERGEVSENSHAKVVAMMKKAYSDPYLPEEFYQEKAAAQIGRDKRTRRFIRLRASCLGAQWDEFRDENMEAPLLSYNVPRRTQRDAGVTYRYQHIGAKSLMVHLGAVAPPLDFEAFMRIPGAFSHVVDTSLRDAGGSLDAGKIAQFENGNGIVMGGLMILHAGPGEAEEGLETMHISMRPNAQHALLEGVNVPYEVSMRVLKENPWVVVDFHGETERGAIVVENRGFTFVESVDSYVPMRHMKATFEGGNLKKREVIEILSFEANPPESYTSIVSDPSEKVPVPDGYVFVDARVQPSIVVTPLDSTSILPSPEEIEETLTSGQNTNAVHPIGNETPAVAKQKKAPAKAISRFRSIWPIGLFLAFILVGLALLFVALARRGSRRDSVD